MRELNMRSLLSFVHMEYQRYACTLFGRDTKEIIKQSKEMNTHENKLISISDFLFYSFSQGGVLAPYTEHFTLESHFGAHIACYLYSNLPNEVNR